MKTPYKQRRVGGTAVREHVLIVGPVPAGYVRDHIDGNGWNNAPDNLRIVTRAANALNTNKTSGVRRRSSGRWSAYITINQRQHSLGTFDTEEAARAARRAAVENEIERGVYVPLPRAVPKVR